MSTSPATRSRNVLSLVCTTSDLYTQHTQKPERERKRAHPPDIQYEEPNGKIVSTLWLTFHIMEGLRVVLRTLNNILLRVFWVTGLQITV